MPPEMETYTLIEQDEYQASEIGGHIIIIAQHESKRQPERLRYNYFTAGKRRWI
ncbi:hypothetical protein CASFOL_015191 [Castilleja foliolosa]|uniref:Uncharacterized protein n=1 Tax=Castilleja foliolosa TaxID=1961234 RepID=A0ABD3DDE4_9LAMI